MFRMDLPSPVKQAIAALNDAGYEANIVGGCVRDALMNVPPHDYDITTSATPEQMQAVFCGERVIETGIRHGTLTVLINSMPLEITTYRIESAYSDHRHPDDVVFTQELRADLSRRDFTMNAIAYHPSLGLTDPFDGASDIQNGIIRCVGNPALRFEEDALRMMRALRFRSVLGFAIEPQTAHAVHEYCPLLQYVSAERIADELNKLLCGKLAGKVITEYTDVLGQVLPELLPMRGFNQNNPYHIYDVLTHTAHVVQAIEPVPDLRLAALLHDTGKPSCYTQDERGGHFYGHAKVSAALADRALRRLKYDTATREKVVALITAHDIPIQDTENAVRRALRRYTPALYYDLLSLHRADNAGQSPALSYRTAVLDRAKQLAQEIVAQQQCFSLRDLAVNGNDLLLRGHRQGKELGALLERLLDAVIEGTVPNEKEALLLYADTLTIPPQAEAPTDRA